MERDEIKVGEYVRTKDGIIGQILEEDDIGENGVCIDTTFLDDWGDDSNYVRFEDIKNHNLNKMDLIEKGDYVNGKEVVTVYKHDGDGNDKGIIETDGNFAYGVYLKDINIKSIVTKEQFEFGKYNF